jgi:hypothetical protein
VISCAPQVTFFTGSNGQISNLTFYTNQSRVWRPYWPISLTTSTELSTALPPSKQEWKGPPVTGDWYLAYTAASLWGWCTPALAFGNVSTAPLYYATPLLYFGWAAGNQRPLARQVRGGTGPVACWLC